MKYFLRLNVIVYIVSISIYSQTFDLLKDYTPGKSIIYQFNRSASPSDFIYDTTSTIHIFNGTYRVYTDSVRLNEIDSIRSYYLSVHKVGTEINRNRLRIIWSRNIDTVYNDLIEEHLKSDYNSADNKIKGWLFPDTVGQSPRCPEDSTIYYPYPYYYRFYHFPSQDTFDLRGDTLLLTNVVTDCFDVGFTSIFEITKGDGLLMRRGNLYNFFDWSFTDTYSKDEVSSIISNTTLPQEFGLNYNYPNPFNPATKILYSLPELSFVTLRVYDVLGKEVTTLVNEEKPSGSYEVEFDGANLSSGVYYYRLKAGDFVETKKMILIK